MWSSLIYGSYKTDEQNQILEIKFLQSKLADKKRSCSVHFHVDLLSKISTQCCQIVQDLYLELSCWGIPCCSGKLLCVLEKLLGIDIDILWYMMYIYILPYIYIFHICICLYHMYTVYILLHSVNVFIFTNHHILDDLEHLECETRVGRWMTQYQILCSSEDVRSLRWF